MNFKQKLIEMMACSNAIKWVGNKTLKEAWETCERADWMMWLLARMTEKPGWSSHKEIVAVCCDIAESVLHLVPKNEDRPRKAIEVTRLWIEGKASIEDVRIAVDDADAVYANAYAANTAYAVYVAANTANAAVYANAAYAAAVYAATRKEKHIEICNLIREKLTFGDI